MLKLPEPYATHLPPLLSQALAEDLPDITSHTLFPPEHRCGVEIVVKKPGVVCGVPAAAAALVFLDPTAQVESMAQDGQLVSGGQVVLRAFGQTRALLAAERTALNFLMRLSGVATAARAFVQALAGTSCRLLDTRKTTPGFRRLEKHAVACGGGVNHRMGLFDAVMIKDNHLALFGSLAEAVGRVRRAWGEGVPLVVECGNLQQLEEALRCQVSHILLDNMDLETLRQAVQLTQGRATLEASGGINLENARAVAETGVDYISVGAITHSAPALDCSMEVGR